MFGLYRGSSAGTSYFEVGDYVDYSNITCIDLTLMFGAGNEPSTVAEFEALYPLPYYDYNQGALINNAAEGVKTVGFNLWDEEWEVGAFDTTTGAKKTATNTIRSKNYIKVFPNTAYYLSLAPKVASVYYYDSNQNFISFEYNASGLRTTPANCYYMMFVGTSTYGTTYANDICVNISDTSRNGTYEPHWESVLELGLGEIKVKSPNIWDEQWENGMIDTNTGQDASGNYVRSKNYIPCKASTKYAIFKTLSTNNLRIFQYDSEKNFIRVDYFSAASSTIETTSACAYFRFYIWSDTSYSSSNGITICESGHGFDGKYFPYGDGGVISITGGLKSAGTVYDEISGGKLIKRIDVEDMTGKTWTRQAYGERYRFYAQRPAPAPSSTENVICPKYIQNKYVTDGASSAVDKSISIAYDRIYIIDDSYTDTTAFSASLAGVPLYYELATPEEYELADTIPTAMRNDPYGTEERLPEDTAAIVTAPFRADITYSTNIKEAVQSMHQNFINVNSMQDFLAELGTLMGGTWTMRPADGKFDFTFTPNPSNE